MIFSKRAPPKKSKKKRAKTTRPTIKELLAQIRALDIENEQLKDKIADLEVGYWL